MRAKARAALSRGGIAFGFVRFRLHSRGRSALRLDELLHELAVGGRKGQDGHALFRGAGLVEGHVAGNADIVHAAHRVADGIVVDAAGLLNGLLDHVHGVIGQCAEGVHGFGAVLGGIVLNVVLDDLGAVLRGVVVGEVDVLVSAQIAGGVVLRAVKAVAAHDRALEAGLTCLRDNFRADCIVVVRSEEHIRAGGGDGRQLRGEVHGAGIGRGLFADDLDAVFLGRLHERIVQAGGVGVAGRIQHGGFCPALILGVGRDHLALEAVLEAGTENVVILGGDGVCRGARRHEHDALIVSQTRDRGRAARERCADDGRRALAEQRVEAGNGLGRGALVVLGGELHGRAEDAAGGVDLIDRQLDGVRDGQTVGRLRAGHRGNVADNDLLARQVAGRRIIFCITAASACGQRKHHHHRKQQCRQSFQFHVHILLFLIFRPRRWVRLPVFVFFPFFVGEGNKKRQGSAPSLFEDVLPCTLLL